MSERSDRSAEGLFDVTGDPTLETAEQPSEERSGRRSLLASAGELILLVIIAFALAWLIKTFVVQPFYIPSASMEPTLVPRDHVLVNKFLYRFAEPGRGDIIVFKYPVDPTKDYIKRVVGVPGDKIKVVGGVVYRNDKRVSEKYLALPHDSSDFPAEGDQVTVPRDKFFVMGDNRANSADSRVWGFLPQENIIGRAFVIYFPVQRISLVD